jgi:hypothetical protein
MPTKMLAVAEALGAAGAQQFLQAAAEQGDHFGHQADVIEDGDQRGEEDDHRQHVEGEDEAQLELGQIPEQEGNPLLAVADDAADALADTVQDLLTGGQPEHQGGEEHFAGRGQSPLFVTGYDDDYQSRVRPGPGCSGYQAGQS